MPGRLQNGIFDPGNRISKPGIREMVQVISRFAMSEHTDLTFGTKEGCLDGTQTSRKLGGGRSSVEAVARHHRGGVYPSYQAEVLAICLKRNTCRASRSLACEGQADDICSQGFFARDPERSSRFAVWDHK
jgi:hypothetical protein